MAIILRRDAWRRQPERFMPPDFAHPLMLGADHPSALMYVMNPGCSLDITSAAYNTGAENWHWTNLLRTGNDCIVKQNSSSNPLLKTNREGFGWGDSGSSPSYGNSGLLIDSTNNTQGTVYWGQQPASAHNSGTVYHMWGIHGGGVPELTAQHYSDNNLYVGWNTSGHDDRASVATTAAMWTSGTINHWAFTWNSGTKAKLYNNGAVIATASNNTNVTTFSGSTAWGVKNSIDSVGGTFSAFLGQMLYHYLFFRQHDLGMVEAMYDNPYQVFLPRVRRNYFVAPSAAAIAYQSRQVNQAVNRASTY